MDARAPAPSAYVFGPFRLEPGRLRLSRDGRELAATPRVFDTLLHLVQNAGRTVSKDEMLRVLWPGRIADEANLSQAISSVRKLLAPDGELIVTVPRQGYRFVGEVEIEPDGLATASTPPADVKPPAASTEPRSSNSSLALAHGPPVSRPRPPRTRQWAAICLGAAALVAFAGWRLATGGSHLPSGRTGVVIADLQNDTGDPDFDHVVPRALRIDLEQSPFLQVAPDSKVAETLGLMEQPRTAPLTSALARTVCARNDGGATVAPSIARLGRRYLLTVVAEDCVSGRELAAEKTEAADKEEVASALDSLSSRLRRQLGEAQASISNYDVPLAAARTSSFDALHAYSEGAWLAAQGKVVDAIPLYDQAIALDPKFAQAYLGLAQAYFGARQYLEDAQAMTKAYALRSMVSAREQLFITYRYNYVVTKDDVAALQSLKALVRIYPGDAMAWTNLSYLQDDLGEYDDAIASGRKALALDSRSPAPYVVLMRALIRGGHPEHVEEIGERAMKRGVADARVRQMLILNRSQTGDEAGSERMYRSTIVTPYEHDAILQYASDTWGQGRGRYTQQLIARADELGRRQGLRMDWAIVAACYADLGMDDATRQLLKALPPELRTDKYLLTAAMVNDPASARAELERALARWPQDTLLHEEYAPEARATLLMREGDPAAAVRVMDAAQPFRFRNLDAPFVRAQALLQAKDAAGAAAAFREILTHAGWSNWAHYPLSHLGLARALKLSGDLAGSRREYQAFLKAWSAADLDLPAYRQARAEYAALPAAPRR
jgi:eukaryotic-like serine/threonine-protein kinase